MKRQRFFLGILAGGLLVLGDLPAQDPATAAAEREAAEREQADRYRTMNTRLTQLEATLQSFQIRLNDLRGENRKLREEIDRLKNKDDSAATQESIKRLADKVEEVDKKRLSDNDKTLKALRELEKLILDRPRTPTSQAGNSGTPADRAGDAPRHGTPAVKTGTTEVGWEYTILDGDTLSGIVARLAKRGLKVPQKVIIDANPGVNWNRLRPGSKIFIPSPQ